MSAFVDPDPSAPDQDMAWKQIASDWQQIAGVFGGGSLPGFPFVDPAPEIPNYDMACKQIAYNVQQIAALI